MQKELSFRCLILTLFLFAFQRIVSTKNANGFSICSEENCNGVSCFCPGYVPNYETFFTNPQFVAVVLEGNLSTYLYNSVLEIVQTLKVHETMKCDVNVLYFSTEPNSSTTSAGIKNPRVQVIPFINGGQRISSNASASDWVNHINSTFNTFYKIFGEKFTEQVESTAKKWNLFRAPDYSWNDALYAALRLHRSNFDIKSIDLQIDFSYKTKRPLYPFTPLYLTKLCNSNANVLDGATPFCPGRYQDLWIVPNNAFFTLNGSDCYTLGDCQRIMQSEKSNESLSEMIRRNFIARMQVEVRSQFNGFWQSREPIVIVIGNDFFAEHSKGYFAAKTELKKIFSYMSDSDQVYFVTLQDIVNWLKSGSPSSNTMKKKPYSRKWLEKSCHASNKHAQNFHRALLIIAAFFNFCILCSIYVYCTSKGYCGIESEQDSDYQDKFLVRKLDQQNLERTVENMISDLHPRVSVAFNGIVYAVTGIDLLLYFASKRTIKFDLEPGIKTESEIKIEEGKESDEETEQANQAEQEKESEEETGQAKQAEQEKESEEETGQAKQAEQEKEFEEEIEQTKQTEQENKTDEKNKTKTIIKCCRSLLYWSCSFELLFPVSFFIIYIIGLNGTFSHFTYYRDEKLTLKLSQWLVFFIALTELISYLIMIFATCYWHKHCLTDAVCNVYKLLYALERTLFKVSNVNDKSKSQLSGISLRLGTQNSNLNMWIGIFLFITQTLTFSSTISLIVASFSETDTSGGWFDGDFNYQSAAHHVGFIAFFSMITATMIDVVCLFDLFYESWRYCNKQIFTASKIENQEMRELVIHAALKVKKSLIFFCKKHLIGFSCKLKTTNFVMICGLQLSIISFFFILYIVNVFPDLTLYRRVEIFCLAASLIILIYFPSALISSDFLRRDIDNMKKDENTFEEEFTEIFMKLEKNASEENSLKISDNCSDEVEMPITDNGEDAQDGNQPEDKEVEIQKVTDDSKKNDTISISSVQAVDSENRKIKQELKLPHPNNEVAFQLFHRVIPPLATLIASILAPFLNL